MQSNFDDLQLIPLPNERCPHCVYSKMLQGKKETAHVSVELKNKIFHVSNSPINHANGRTSKLTVYRDITETKVMEVRLQQAQKMEAIGTLAGGIAHDFNNILFPIVGHTEMLLEDFPENNPLRDSLNEIYSGAMRARDLVKQILTFSRQEKNELKLIKLQPIVKEALKMIRSTIPTSISIHQNLESTCGAVKADPTQIHQIVMNLATNAYHAMEKNGEELKIFLRQLELEKDDLISMEKMVLQRLGYHVTARTSSIEALEAFRAGTDKFDMVITDMAMPKMPGDTLALELIKIRKDIPVILCTGFSETMNEEQLAARGIAGLLLKPIISKDLAEKIRNIFDGSKNV